MSTCTYEIEGYLNNYGFCIKKKKLNPQIANILDKYFSVKPELNYENEKIKEEDKYFKVYYSDNNYIVIPKFSTNIKINVSKYIKENKNDKKKTIKIDDIEYSKITFVVSKYKYKNELSKFDFKGKLRDYQQVIIDEVFKKFGLNSSEPTNHAVSQSFPKGGLIKLSCGGGKCLGFNTPVMMCDGSIKMVQDVKVGDKLMGDDSKPREVLSLARGKETMYKITQECGDDYIVNSSHILSLYNPKTNKIVDIGVQDFLKIGDTEIYTGDDTIIENNGLYGFKKVIEFEETDVPYEPYYLANWIFGETKEDMHFSFCETMKIERYIYECRYNKEPPEVFNFQWKYYVIPECYIYNSSSVRKKFLAGILTSSCSKFNEENNFFEIETKNAKIINSIIYITQSLGINVKKINKFKINLFGNNIWALPFPKRFGYKKCKFKTINYYPIKIKQLEEADYYGFEIDGNRRFLLGDFTVTHNTMLAIYLAWALGLKTLVVTHKEFLMDQWEERIEQFTTAKVGRIRQNVVVTKDKDIVIGMLRSLSIKDYPTDILQEFGLVIYDEVHHTGSRVDSQALLKTSAQYTLGLSATPDRADGMTKVINWHIGDILYEMEKKYNYRVLVKKIFFRSSDPLFKEKTRYFQGRFAPNHTKMTENIISIQSRNQLLVNIIDVLKGMGRKILVLSYRVEHLELLKKMVDDKIKLDGETHIYNSYFYMGKTKRGEKKLAEKDGHIIFATMQLAEEGLDISHLDTVLFALPVSIQKDKKKKGRIKSSKALIQSIGRILRNDKLEDLTQIPLVVDVSDMFSIYSNWSNKRDEIYGKKNWYLQHYYWDDLKFVNSSCLSEENKNKPYNVMFDDITDEDFIEKNLMITDEEAQKITLQDKKDELDELNDSESSEISQISDKTNKVFRKTKKINDEIIETKPVYAFGKKK
jgi:superfamily II DNA or RNA helicase